ncbi:zeta toxin family protein [Acinetobacter puyangensis]|uniref:zeta toxin family protein n=1 Tax=Acinetobacter puyangensis TaxID=1096779 RepID=UPI003A4D4643
MAKVPRLRMFAGPNGSGKSTIKEIIPIKILGIYLNADDIEKQLRETPQFDFSVYDLHIDADAFLDFLSHHQRITIDPECLPIQGTLLDCSKISIDSYFASTLVDFLRFELLRLKKSFTFETVMSHQSKVEFLQLAQQQGYRTYLYYIATIDPEINVSRVQYRVQTGGHAVARDKIIKRYYNSLELLIDAIFAAGRAFIFDNSSDGGQHAFLCEINAGQELVLQADAVPQWFQHYVLQRF